MSTAKHKARDDAWRLDPRMWEVHVDGYTHRRAIEHAARKHADLGRNFLALLAARLVLVDVDKDDARPTPRAALARVTAWAEGRR